MTQPNIYKCITSTICGVMIIVERNGPCNPSWNPQWGKADYIPHSTHVFGKGMNYSPLAPLWVNRAHWALYGNLSQTENSDSGCVG